jgi:glycosyltransferase involved in cell wall biosynthesis
MEKPEVEISIITVSLNSEATILVTIESIDHQSFTNWEHLIIDGLSDDKTSDIVSGKADARRKFISEKDTGIYDAMNKGIRLAKGNIVVILNSDDKLACGMVLQKIVEIFRTKNCDVIYSGIAFINPVGKRLITWIPEKFSKGSYARGFHTPHPGFFVRRKIYDALGVFDTNLKIAADFDLMLRVMETENVKLEYYPHVTVEMRADGASAKFKNILIGFGDILSAFQKAEINVNRWHYAYRRYVRKVQRKLVILLKGGG